jgi:hypothetical protein
MRSFRPTLREEKEVTGKRKKGGHELMTKLLVTPENPVRG